ncbi:hypothetical protein JEOAER750_02184 [Jeotgalicoccus aerolatus]|uniref:ABC-type polysaccharide/polyol phosphate export permease n=1 Tax=Jeotgalicoccus aerolatus TaxID=709510 RepID=A0ABS4HPD7_9STAP|nr:hypothetical protein [Jeotgalicoccus aerolatus]MBP1952718.1 ABC-type polysaccharide/polyol phosphate export permease [Jeotgalicoccus aerolatus]GGE08713.1 hypothetical protein GCM10007273_21300 [Jeotgalicoccus aerolatus]CAD2080912.1 hypothetical protein JEOAER750_02184 [Jeotgalicoccus aerolatus]
MNYRFKYLFRRVFRQADRFTLLNLTPALIYLAGLALLFIGFFTAEDDTMVRVLYSAVGFTAAVWIFSMVILNKNEAYVKDSILKVNYIPLYLRILPTMIYQTIMFIIFITMYSAFAALFVDNWMMNIYSLIYYILLGVILVIPFTMLFLGASIHINTSKINPILFIIVLLIVPVFYLPEQLPSVIENILSLNPFYYVINGLQNNAIHQAWSVNRLPYDVLYVTQVAILYLWMFEAYSKMKIQLYNDKNSMPDL